MHFRCWPIAYVKQSYPCYLQRENPDSSSLGYGQFHKNVQMGTQKGGTVKARYKRFRLLIKSLFISYYLKTSIYKVV